MKGEVVIPDGGISTIHISVRTYETGTQVFAARVYVEGYPACTVPLTYGDKVSLAVRGGLAQTGLVKTDTLDAYCIANGITINYHTVEVGTFSEVREWGTPGWEDDIRWHKGHELVYELTMTTQWPIDSRTTAINVKANEGKRTIEHDSLYCKTCNAVVQGVVLERTTELDLIINQRGEGLAGTYEGATK